MSTVPPDLQAREQGQLRTRLSAPAALRLWHLTSLDAPTVAIVWTVAFSWASHVQLPAWPIAVIALAAWCVYIGDRLLDARRARTPLRERHHFHWKHRYFFLPIALAAALVAIGLVIHSMPIAARERNSVLAAAALAYFTSVHSPWRVPNAKRWFRFPKELLVGVLFTVACVTPAFTRIAGPIAIAHLSALLATLLVYILLAWLNCYSIETWESRPYRRSTILRPATALAAAAVVAAIFAVGLQETRSAAFLAMAAVSAALLGGLDRRQHSLTPIALRVCADLALLTPLALLVLPGRLVP